jgi:EAL domain-containing protein (putative c-di-GMP-specific phosphodiesterase class I)
MDVGLRYPTGTATYLTDDPALRQRLVDLASEVGYGRALENGSVEIDIPEGAETSACLLFGSSLPEYDQDRVYVIVDGATRTVSTLRSLLGRCQYEWFLEFLITGVWSSHFQPIIRVGDRETVGYEALLRARQNDGRPVSPAIAIAGARATGKLREFDRRARTTALVDACSRVPEGLQLFINMDPGSINLESEIDELTATVDGCARKRGDVVFEFLESESLVTSTRVSWLRAALRERGFLVALDDLTSGHSTLLVLERLRPDVAKLDRALVTGAWQDRFRRRLVQAFVDLCGDLEIPLVVEGVETSNDFAFVTDVGAELAQGYFFGREPEPVHT